MSYMRTIDLRSYNLIPKFHTIIEAVAKEWVVDTGAILSTSIIERIVEARQVTAYVAYTIGGLDLSQTGLKMGGRTANSTWRAVNEVKKRMQIGPMYKARVEALCFRLQLLTVKGSEKEGELV